MGLIALHAGLATVAFLIVLNGYLRGASKNAIDAGLSVILVALEVGAFVVFGIWQGLLTIGASFVYGAAVNPLAKRLAHRMLGYRTALAEEEDTSIEDLIEGQIDFDEFQERSDRREEKHRKRLDRLGRRSEIRNVLAKHGKSPDDLEEYLWLLRRAGQGAVAWDYLSDPRDLDLIIRLDEEEKNPIEILARLMD